MESSPGLGTTLRVSLPPEVRESASQSRSSTPPPSERRELRRLRLLIVDDEPALLRVLSIALSDEHDVVTAAGCEAALAILARDHAFDAILCDLMMPLGDGMLFYERLGLIGLELRRRIVFMTGGAFTEQARTFLETVPNKTLTKPFDPDSLRRVLEALV